MKIESYNRMKECFDLLCVNYYLPDRIYVITYDIGTDTISAGWTTSLPCNGVICVKVDYDVALHFNNKIYEEKLAELQLLIKQYYVNKKLQDIEGDFE